MISKGLLGHFILALGCVTSLYGQSRPKAVWKNESVVITSGGRDYFFTPSLTLLYSEEDPALALRSAGIQGVKYNVPTWKVLPGKKADLRLTRQNASTAGDGFDDRILKGSATGRTPNPYHAAQVFHLLADHAVVRHDTVFVKFRSLKVADVSAYFVLPSQSYPLLHFELKAVKPGWFSVGYSGAPAYAATEVAEIWQPLIWQETRVPDNAYLTMAFRAPIPTTLAFDGKNTIGVIAAPSEYPFQPLPLFENSRFGVMLRNEEGKIQPQIYAPVLGGSGSQMSAGTVFRFSAYLVVGHADITGTFADLARGLYGFHDYRYNDISSLNRTLDRISRYALSSYAWFIDSLKGCAYSTDVPGAVKNVSSLNPLELALVMDDDTFLEKRALPVMEYMLSREKLLFSLDSTQKIQSPSRKMNGPVAPVSELVSLYNIFHKDQSFLLKLAETEYGKTKIRNLDVAQEGKNWMNAMYLYKATGDGHFLQVAERGADTYIQDRVSKPASAFNDPLAGGFFFWPSFTSRWMELLQLYELTGKRRYLEAAHQGARHYAMFTWMSPAVPDSNIVVNKGGKAPMYWYLEQKGHHQMYYPEQWAPAWRLSAVGLTSESAGTSSGHRAIFMANYAPWMLRVGYYTKDTFLMQVAKAAVIGRYRNFPGYHINTARTTAYEKVDFPYHKFMDQSVNSFHYNHIMPMASMLLDYLVSDVFVRSRGTISFPSEYIEGYAYLKSNFYGSRSGKWYHQDSVQLWMPRGLLHLDNVALNYIAARKGHKLFIAFTNQSSGTVTCNVKWDPKWVRYTGSQVHLRYWHDNHFFRNQLLPRYSASWPVEVSPGGITVVEVDGVEMNVHIQDRLLQRVGPWHNDYQQIGFGHGSAMIFNLGGLGERAYIWLKDNDNVYSRVSLVYQSDEGKEVNLTNESYPYEFTIPLSTSRTAFRFRLSGTLKDGTRHESKIIKMGKE